jgi:hypothetical protein
LSAMEYAGAFLAQAPAGDVTYIQYGMAGAVIVVVVLFLRFLSEERKARDATTEAYHDLQRETSAGFKECVDSFTECVDKNTATHARTAAALDRHESLLARVERKIDVRTDPVG